VRDSDTPKPAPDTPTFYRNDDGTVRAEWPDPIAEFYPVSSELLKQWVEDKNELVRLRAKLQAQIVYTQIEYGGCGGLAWTVERWGEMRHKHYCPERTEPRCQEHPDGCEIERFPT
jgi:hypothetical protein